MMLSSKPLLAKSLRFKLNRVLSVRAILLILSFVFLFACAHSGNVEGIVFSDSHGENYNSGTMGAKIKKVYGLDESPRLILLATKSAELEEFKSQLKIIKGIDAEKFQYLYVIANSETVNASGYFTSKMEAEKILGNAKFKIIIYNQSGALVRSSNTVLGEQVMLHHLTKNVSKH